jgi:hypothetical protein
VCTAPIASLFLQCSIDHSAYGGVPVSGQASNIKPEQPGSQAMRKKIDDGGYETRYRLRKQVVEPVFGQIKQARSFQFRVPP